jgi:hypothetical protein
MAKIEDLLHRRTDLSTFLVHLTRSYGGASARENLVSIAKHWTIEARNPLGPARDHEGVLGPAGVTQKVVCFTETPLEHIWMMLESIDGRGMQFQPYGLATTKAAGRWQGCNPVWYSDMTRLGVDWPLKQMGELVDRAMKAARTAGGHDAKKLQDEPFLRIAPYFETMGPVGNYDRKEFWWEREWRHIGDYSITRPSTIVALIAPEAEHASIQSELSGQGGAAQWLNRPMLDPHWGLERMIASLASVGSDSIGPFPQR